MGRSKNSHFNRYSQIANIVARHGLGYFVGILGLERFVPFHQGLLGHSRRTEPYTQPEHIRMAFEELGPTFIKLGQILSTRADLLTPEYQAEFAKLQDQALPVLTNAMEDILAEELGKPINAVFATFDPTPIAAASIGQVYTATLHDGTEVVVKVRRPGIVEQVEEDLEILQNLAVSASYRWELAKQYDVIGLAQEFAQTLRSELDYLREGRNAERFAKNFAHNPNVHIPRIFWESTTSRVLTMERIRGIKVSDLSALNAAGINRKTLAEQIAQLNLQMVFEDGFFHADPHPGNFFIEPNGRIGLIDFGMVGSLDSQTQEHLAGILLAVISQDADRLVDAFLELGFAQQTVDRSLLRRDLQYLVVLYREGRRKERKR
ncbi:ABC1 kinase family protein [Leptolyngbya sp. AN03gr2]|uniref:ABC1 kinase family protein n=1 Tax=unclassified Leptolyngbya TaxID=2650499 RepID=UPI003D3196EF